MKTIVITGSSMGIGFGLASSFLASGCRVVMTGHDQGHLAHAKAVLLKHFHEDQLLAMACDVVCLDDVQCLWDAAVQRFGSLDIWINNAGVVHSMDPLWKLDAEEIRRVIDVNLMGTINGSYVAMRGMMLQGAGHIYNMEGQGADGGIVEGMGVFGTSKAGVHYFSKTLIQEASRTPVKVSTIIPGIIKTSLQEKTAGTTTQGRIFLQMFGEEVGPATKDLARRILSNTAHGNCINRMSAPDMLGKVAGAPFQMLFGR
ncbi:SDR family NAD(P)-dependent oxidoreductase [Prosthecochloris sp. CIB 2401]|uniref:SDR family NAD(P)-dependent oxidoreductase n=1 Tax=Prosthecochloris sp. CIB 2401 TaxID=1868325 RepID=UPI00080A9C62|nr:SDR family oxidoreductase [Prosthecochloris sp. CIB 2401]ANT64028.1 Bile acid 7-dehydroxylase 1/3 [Prosthecochloris sp. CIB 2401]